MLAIGEEKQFGSSCTSQGEIPFVEGIGRLSGTMIPTMQAHPPRRADGAIHWGDPVATALKPFARCCVVRCISAACDETVAESVSEAIRWTTESILMDREWRISP